MLQTDYDTNMEWVQLPALEESESQKKLAKQRTHNQAIRNDEQCVTMWVCNPGAIFSRKNQSYLAHKITSYFWHQRPPGNKKRYKVKPPGIWGLIIVHGVIRKRRDFVSISHQVRDWMIFSWLPMKCLQMPQKMPAWSLRAMSTHHPLNYPFYSTYGNLMTCEVFFWILPTCSWISRAPEPYSQILYARSPQRTWQQLERE